MWMKVDDTLHGHPKARAAGLPAMGLWVLSGSYSMAYKLDGFVPEYFVNGWPNAAKLVVRLVESGLWEPVERDGVKGWEFHDFDDYQPLSDEIEAQREASRERQRRHRQKQSPNGRSRV